jgi:hypothetical protein
MYPWIPLELPSTFWEQLIKNIMKTQKEMGKQFVTHTTRVVSAAHRHNLREQNRVLQCLQDIQGDSGGICATLGNDSMSDFKQKSSYEHGSDFERLRSYGHFLFPVHALM